MRSPNKYTFLDCHIVTIEKNRDFFVIFEGERLPLAPAPAKVPEPAEGPGLPRTPSPKGFHPLKPP